jgi:hypothetical protein
MVDRMTRQHWQAAKVLIAALLAGCAEQPFEYSDYRYHQINQVIICYNESTGTLEQVKAMAEDICARTDRIPTVSLIQKYQCTWTAPTEVTFTCSARPGENPPLPIKHLAPLRRDQQILGQ